MHLGNPELTRVSHVLFLWDLTRFYHADVHCRPPPATEARLSAIVRGWAQGGECILGGKARASSFGICYFAETL